MSDRNPLPPTRYDKERAIEYGEVERLKEVLVGRRITGMDTAPGETGDDVIFFLDDGTRLRAHSTDGGCACSNGCFSVSSPSPPVGRIMSVEMEDPANTGGDGYAEGETAIKLFVLTEFGKETLVVSEGADNGYYGWGFWLSVHKEGEA